MITLSYGFKKPGTGDKGSEFFPALEQNIQKVNDHNHDGLNSSLMSPLSITKGEILIANDGLWNSAGEGFNRNVNLPLGYVFDHTNMTFFITDANHSNQVFYPSYSKITDGVFLLSVVNSNCSIRILLS